MASNTNKLPEDTNWLSASDRAPWFDRFKFNPSSSNSQEDQSNSEDIDNDNEEEGLYFEQFVSFIDETIYCYLDRQVGRSLGQGCRAKFTPEREARLFQVFDQNGDELLDSREFELMCERWLDKVYRRSSALIVVDVQNDFIDGSLALIKGPARQDGLEVVDVINRMLQQHHFDVVVYTQDWHPPDHIGFHANLHKRKFIPKRTIPSRSDDEVASPEGANNGASEQQEHNGHPRVLRLRRLANESQVQMFDTVLFEDGKMEQKMWPIHCVQGSWGAQLHPDLRVQPNSVRILKGTLSNVDAYSAFWDNMKLNETGLRQALTSRGVDDVYVCGLALDYCVSASAIDSARAGFLTLVVEDACRGIDDQEIERRRCEMVHHGVLLTQSRALAHLMCGKRSHNQPDDDNNNNGVNNIRSPTVERVRRVKNKSPLAREERVDHPPTAEEVVKLLLDMSYQRAVGPIAINNNH